MTRISPAASRPGRQPACRPRADAAAMNPVFADLPVSVFEVMSRLAREHDAVNLGQGFPDDPGPEDVRRKAAEAVVDGWNQYPPMLGLPELRQAIAAHYRHWQGLDARSRQRDDGHLGRDRGDRRRAARADRAGRRGRAVPAALRRLSAAGAARRRRAALRAAGAAALALHRGDAGARLLAEDQGGAVQQSAQSGRHRLRPRGPRAAGALLRALRRDRGLRRGVGARGLRRPPARAADRAARHARALRQDRLGRQDLLAHRLEGRLRLRRAAHPARARQGAPVHHLHHAAEPAGGGRLRARQGRRLFRRPCGATSSAAATASPTACGRSAFRCSTRRAPISSTSISRRSGSTRTTRASASASWPSTRWRRSRSPPSMPPTRSARWCASASPSATRRSTPRSSASPACCERAA